MADTQRSGSDGGQDGGHGGRRSGKHAAGRSGGRNGRRKSRRNGEARERNEGGGANGPSDDLDSEEEITLHGDPITPLLANQQMRNGERYSAPEGVPVNGWTYIGLNEPITGNGGPENALVYRLHISRMALTLRSWSYAVPNEPIPTAQNPGNNGVVQAGQLVGVNALPPHIPLNAWASNGSRGGNDSMKCNPVTDFLCDFNPNGGPPAPNA